MRHRPHLRPGHLRNFIFACITLGLLSSSCSPKYYVPNTHNVPLMQQKGESTAALASGAWRTELQAAHAITDNMALLLNTAFFYPEDDEEGDGGKRQIFEVGLGHYQTLAPDIIFEIYPLLAIGTLENHFPSTLTDHPTTTGKIKTTLFRYGIQSALGHKSKYFDAAISTRLVGLNYSNTSGNLIFSRQSQIDYLQEKNTHLLLEPALTLRTGHHTLKLQIQLGKSFNLSNPNFRQDNGHLTIGAVYYN